MMEWANEGKIETENIASLRDAQQMLIIIGPGGTGKTTIREEMCDIKHRGTFVKGRHPPGIVQTPPG